MAVTRREQEMLDLHEQGMPAAAIAERMGIKASSVRRAISQLGSGLGINHAERRAMTACSDSLLTAIARLRGDIAQLPCVISAYASPADEAASFVHLNQRRRPLSKLDLFKAAVVSEDGEAAAIMAAITGAGLSLAPHTNYTAWKPGMLSNIPGIEAAWRKHGSAVTSTALRILASACAGQVLRYAGTIFPGIVAIVAAELKKDANFADDTLLFETLVDCIAGASQEEWRGEIAQARGRDPNLKFAAASARVFLDAWNEVLAELLDEAA